MAAFPKLTKNCLPQFTENVRKKQTLHERTDPITVLVIGVERYMGDPTIHENLRCDTIFDITITDSTEKMKCVLASQLNALVQKNQLKVGCVIKLLDCSVHYDELNVNAGGILVLKDVQIVTFAGHFNHLNLENISFCASSSIREKTDCPLLGIRGYYLPLWNSEDPEGTEWKPAASLEISKDKIDVGNRIEIARLAREWKGLRPFPPLVVRVLHKTRLNHYGKTHKKGSWHYQVYLEIADSSGTCTAVMWTSLCPEKYHSIQEGTVMIVKRFTVRQKFLMRTTPTIRCPDLQEHDIEINLNKSNPATDIILVHPANVLPEWELQPLKYNFITRRQLGSLPEDYNCDIAGVITFIGRYERERKKGGGPYDGEGLDFWLKRWLHVKDHTSQSPFILEVYNTSQPQLDLSPGQLLVATQMRVVCSNCELHHSWQQRYPFLTSSNETQLYTTGGHHRGHYRNEPIIQQLTRWCNTEEGRESVRQPVIGGYYSYPPLPNEWQYYQDSFSDEKPMQMISFQNLKHELEGLHYRERRQLIVQGFIIHIKHTRGAREEGSEEEEDQDTSPISQRTRFHASQKRPHTKESAAADSRKARKPTKETHEVLLDPDWERVKEAVEILGEERASPQFLPRYYIEAQSLYLKQEFGLTPSHFKTVHGGNIDDTPSPLTQGCFIFTVLGLNNELAIHLTVPISQAAPLLSIPEQLKYYKEVYSKKRVVCVVDAHHCGGNTVECVLNQAYVVS